MTAIATATATETAMATAAATTDVAAVSVLLGLFDFGAFQ